MKKNEVMEGAIIYVIEGKDGKMSLDEMNPVTAPIPEEIIQGEIGETYKKLRLISGATQSDIAKIAGCDQAEISRFENGKAGDSKLSTVIRYFNAIGLKLAVIKSSDIVVHKDMQGFGLGTESGTVSAGVIAPMESRVFNVQYSEEYKRAPDVQLQIEAGDHAKVMPVQITKEGMVGSVINLGSKPEKVTATYQVKERR